MFQSNRTGIFVDCSLYRASRLFGKIRGENDDDIGLIDGVEGSDNDSGRDDNVVSEEISIGSFTKFGSPCE